MNPKTRPLASASLAPLLLLASACDGPATGTANTPVEDLVSSEVARDPDAASAAIASLFADPAMGETRALLVLKDGDIVFERYGDDYDADSKLIAWSMAKSITAIVAGLMVADGRLALDEPVPVPAWQRPRDPRGDITLRQLLQMSSGLAHDENGEPVWDRDQVRVLFLDGARDMARYAEAKPLIGVPGERFNYSSATSIIIADILARTLAPGRDARARRDRMLAFIDGRLSQPLGLAGLTPEFDDAGTMIGGSIMHATARDYAKLGELLRNGGVHEGQRLLPQSWVRFMLTPSPADPGYGGHVWLNRERPEGSNAALWPEAGPSDLFAFLGHQGQYVVVSPSKRLTIVRLGISTDAQIPEVREALRELSSAM